MHAVAAASRLTSCLYRGLVTHQRLGRKTQRFCYPVTSWLIDLDEIPALERRLRLFSHNRFNLLSLRDRDLGARELHELHGLRVHAFPRVLGIGFSPLTTWFCYEACGRLAAVQYEVHNTFGERHSYLALLDDRPLPRTLRHRTDKLFHVSPFLDLSGSYRMALRAPAP